MTSEKFERLSTRQREYLRLVFQHRTSHEIAFETGVSARAVDKQLLLAKGLLGANSRFEAARMFAEHEAAEEGVYLPSAAPARPPFWPLPAPIPTKRRPQNSLSLAQVLAWGVIIAIATPIAITVAAMVIVSLSMLLRTRLL